MNKYKINEVNNHNECKLLFNVLKNAIGETFISDIEKKIQFYIQSLNVTQLKDSSKCEAASINFFCEALQSLKLLLELLVWQIDQKTFAGEIIIAGNLLQCVRDVLDLDPCDDIVCSALDLLKEICKLCAIQYNDDDNKELVQFYLYQLLLTQHSSSDSNLRLRLRVLNTLLTSVLNNFNVNGLSKFKEESQKENDSVVESRLFLKIIFEYDDSISAQALFTILPLYVVLFDSPSTLTIIWNEALQLKKIESDFLKHFTILCFIFDKFATIDVNDYSDVFNKILQDEKFWFAVQYGLTHHENVIRRQALYLFKRSIQETYDRNLSICSHKLNEISGNNFADQLDGGLIKLTNGMKNFTVCNSKMFLVSNDHQHLFWWQEDLREELCILFNDIFLVLETLEEKQSHLVKPIFHTLIRLLGPTICPFRNGKYLHISWILVLFQRILQHDNTAVVKWGLLNLMEVDLNCYQVASTRRNILKLLICHLNNQSIYVNDSESVGQKLKCYFQAVALANENISKPFFKELIQEICLMSWSPESLFLVLDALQDVKVTALESEQLLVLKNFVATSISSHYTFLRAAIQCHIINIITNLVDASLVNLDSIADLLSVFRGPECFQKGSDTWNSVIKWIGFSFSKRNAEEYIVANFKQCQNKTVNLKKVSRMVCLLYDAHLFGLMMCCGEVTSVNISAAFQNLLRPFTDSDKRLYAHFDILFHNLEIISGILKENIADNSTERSSLIEIMIPHFGPILSFILSRCRVFNSITDYKAAQLFIESFKYILKAQNIFRVNAIALVNELFIFSIESLGMTGTAKTNPMLSYISMNFLKVIIENVYADSAVPKLKCLQAFFKKNVNVALEKTENDAGVDTSHVWGRINGEYLEAQWYIIGRLKSENILIMGKEIRVEQFMTPAQLGDKCVAALSLGGSEVLKAVLSAAEDLLPELSDEDVEVLVHTAWTALFESRKCEAFHVSARHFMLLLYQPEIVKKCSLLQIMSKYGEILLSDNIHGLANTFLSHIQSLKIKYSLNPLWEFILPLALVYGNASRRDDRLTVEVCSIIRNIPCAANKLVNNEWNTSGEVRARAFQILLSLSPGTPSGFVDAIAESLMLKEVQLDASKVRSFAGSPVHLFLTRILQALLVIEPLLSKEKALKTYTWSCELLLKTNHQPSVRYMAEWLIVRILCRNPEWQNSLWLNFTEALERRVGNLCCFISIAFHTISVLPNSTLESWIDRAFLQFLPYCSAQHFSLRLYAQVAIEKMWEKAIQLNLQHILNKYQIMHDCQLRAIVNGNALLNIDKLRQDFYWTVFDPLKHYSLQTIFRDLPRLAHIKSNEWITVELFQKVGVVSEVFIPSTSGDELWLHPVAKWNIRNEETMIEVPSDNFQKKMIPVKSLLPDYEQLLSESVSGFSRKQQNCPDGLIVVASLIDRAANLGGLSRTCEAFGVSELVVDSIKIVEDKQFQSLSVTSEKWVPITEVKIQYLTEYLLSMKSEGYIVVGAEQTSRSEPLPKCELPRKSILLLGSEKEGIPPNLLPLLDVCVEVPQLGVIRSLNVHVTAALFIWEYAKQHAFTQI